MLLVLPHFSHTRVPLPLSFAYIFLMFMVTFPSDLPRMTCRMLNSLCASRHPVHQLWPDIRSTVVLLYMAIHRHNQLPWVCPSPHEGDLCHTFYRSRVPSLTKQTVPPRILSATAEKNLRTQLAESLLMDHSRPCWSDGQSRRTQVAALDCADELTTLWRERGMARHNVSLAQQALNASAQPKPFWKSGRASNRRETLASPYWHHAGRVPESHAPRSDG